MTPFSSDTFDTVIARIIARTRPRVVLDVGAGAGKYGSICRSVLPAANLIAVEVDASYISRYDLRRIYDNVIVASVTEIVSSRTDYGADLIVAGDVIEHLTWSDGMDLLHYCLYHSTLSIFVFPSEWVQGAWDNRPQETHISAWFTRDFIALGAATASIGQMNLAILPGYRPQAGMSPAAILQIAQRALLALPE